MRALILAAVMVFIGQMAYAGPTLTSDPNPGAEVYRINLPTAGFNNEIIPAGPNGEVNIDLIAVPPGSHTGGTIEAGADWILNGVPQGIMEWSAPVPLSLTRPDPSAPSGEVIVP